MTDTTEATTPANRPVSDELQRLYDRDGKLTPEQVVAEATDPDSPLHDSFEWDDSTAAHNWRLHKARNLIARVEVTVHTPEQVTIRQRVFLSTPNPRQYVHIRDIEAHPELKQDVINELTNQLVRLRSKLAAFDHFADVVRAIDRTT